MKDSLKALRDSYMSLLSDQITYNGSVIPVYDQEADPTGNDFYIVLSTATDVPIENRGRFVNETTIVIDVITRVNYTLTKQTEVVDIITGKIFELVIPSIGTSGLSDTADFQITNVRKESSEHLPILDSGTKKIVRRVTRFSQTLIEK
jgi:hypothetical protein